MTCCFAPQAKQAGEDEETARSKAIAEFQKAWKAKHAPEPQISEAEKEKIKQAKEQQEEDDFAGIYIGFQFCS